MLNNSYFALMFNQNDNKKEEWKLEKTKRKNIVYFWDALVDI